jgi:FkbM family methyltransferase
VLRIKLIETGIELLEHALHLRILMFFRRSLAQPGFGSVIFDVGANKGALTKLYLKLYKDIKIIAFEPLPIFKIKSERVEWMQVALCADVGTKEFYECIHKPSSSLSLPDISSEWLKKKAQVLGVYPKDLYKNIEIQATKVDQIVAERSIKEIFLLKIDTEGTELEVLKGSVDSLRSGVIVNIQLEQHSNDLRKNGSLEIQKMLAGYGYTRKKTINHYFGKFSEEFFART